MESSGKRSSGIGAGRQSGSGSNAARQVAPVQIQLAGKAVSAFSSTSVRFIGTAEWSGCPVGRLAQLTEQRATADSKAEPSAKCGGHNSFNIQVVDVQSQR